MSRAQSFSDISEPGRAILQALESADDNVMRRVDLDDVVEEPYPPHEQSLLNKGLIEEVGVHSTIVDDERVVYRRFALTEAGDRFLHRARSTESSDPEDSVEPRRRKVRNPWHKRAEWTDLSPDVPKLLEMTNAVTYDETADEIHIEMERGDRERTIEFSNVQWLANGGYHPFCDQYYSAFHEYCPLDKREFGMLQALWVERYAGDGVEDESKTAKERAMEYLTGEGADASIRQAAEHLDVSVGTVQNARSELNGDE